MFTPVNQTQGRTQFIAFNEQAQDYINKLNPSQMLELQKNFLEHQTVYVQGYVMGDNFDYVAFISKEAPEDGDFVFTPDLDMPIRYREQEGARKIIGYSRKAGILL